MTELQIDQIDPSHAKFNIDLLTLNTNCTLCAMVLMTGSDRKVTTAATEPCRAAQ